MTLNPEVVSKAACEVRKAIEKSMYAEYQFGQDQILLLLRVEMTPTHLAAQLARETDPALLISESPLKPE